MVCYQVDMHGGLGPKYGKLNTENWLNYGSNHWPSFLPVKQSSLRYAFKVSSCLELIATQLEFRFQCWFILLKQGEAFPTYPRTYDLVHADGLLSLETSQQRRCTMLDMFILSI
ncbi:probable methyltransferase PMT12 [Arachis hypogaea]|uniref:probable methyltransferase PMT12 n=1 Tax=Arachis hypogaea TaxID=3818 RepID=UPI000DED3790|nr:probable methyltransferase PMT12 [Arachis hypogaea]XP_025644359.1 probable methyltransferase PMT12 [Arachis hypogaea]